MWSYEIMQLDGIRVKTTLNSFDTVAIDKYIRFWHQNPYYIPVLHLQHFDVNVEMMEVTFHENHNFKYKVRRSKNMNRARPMADKDVYEFNKTSEEIIFYDDTFAHALGDFSL